MCVSSVSSKSTASGYLLLSAFLLLQKGSFETGLKVKRSPSDYVLSKGEFWMHTKTFFFNCLLDQTWPKGESAKFARRADKERLLKALANFS